MGAEWPAGAALAMETWPARSRGFMGAVMQGSWGIGFLLSSAIYGLFYNYIGWRGLLMIGIGDAAGLPLERATSPPASTRHSIRDRVLRRRTGRYV